MAGNSSVTVLRLQVPEMSDSLWTVPCASVYSTPISVIFRTSSDALYESEISAETNSVS